MPTRSYSGGATSLRKSRFHKDIFPFISFYPRLSAFIPVEQPLKQPRHRLLDLIHLQIHIPGFSPPAHAQPSNLDLCPAEVDQEAVVNLFQKARTQFMATRKLQPMISPVRGSWIVMARSPHPYLPAHPKKVSTGMKGINGDEKMDKS